ncbi:glycosyltransferase family 2 protein [Chromobacterium alticapitis]|nr:glycosyltransferase family 2 protein [Chromobacterium alticapitis]
MKHSVIIPLYNKRPYIADTLASLARQRKRPHQIIVVDDASSDGSAEEAERALSRHAAELDGVACRMLRLPDNAGPGAARNAGLALADGELVSFLDADDRYRPDCLQKVADCMRAHKLELAVLGFDSAPAAERFPLPSRLSGELQTLADSVHLLPDPLRAAGHPDFFMGRASNVVARRRWLEHERYDASARLNEGIDFWYRVLRRVSSEPGARAGLISEPLIRFRIVADSLSHRGCADWRALAPPPALLRYAGSQDAHDVRLMRMLARRWLDYAMNALSCPIQRGDFLNHHGALLNSLGMAS